MRRCEEEVLAYELNHPLTVTLARRVVTKQNANDHHLWKYLACREELGTSVVSGGMRWLRPHHEVLCGDGWRPLCSVRQNKLVKPTRTYA